MKIQPNLSNPNHLLRLPISRVYPPPPDHRPNRSHIYPPVQLPSFHREGPVDGTKILSTPTALARASFGLYLAEEPLISQMGMGIHHFRSNRLNKFSPRFISPPANVAENLFRRLRQKRLQNRSRSVSAGLLDRLTPSLFLPRCSFHTSLSLIRVSASFTFCQIIAIAWSKCHAVVSSTTNGSTAISFVLTDNPVCSAIVETRAARFPTPLAKSALWTSSNFSPGNITVFKRRELRQYVISDRLGTIFSTHSIGSITFPQTFAHFLSIGINETLDEDLFRGR